MMRPWPVGWRALTILATVSLGGASATALAADASAPPDAPIVFVQLPTGTAAETAPVRDDGMIRNEYGAGGRIVRLDPGGEPRVLTSDFESACEFDVSFDGLRILFAARKTAGEPWGIWEMNADGTGARPIVRGPGNARQPLYLSRLYIYSATDDTPFYPILFVSDAAGTMNECGVGPVTNLYACKLDGSDVRRLTINASNDMDPFLKQDGRVVYAAWQRMDLERGYRGRVALLGIDSDGIDLALFCARPGLRIKQMPCETTDGLVVFVEGDRVPWDGAGTLGCVTLRRHFYDYRPITRGPQGLYHSPSPLPDGMILVSCRPADGRGTHGVYRLNPRTGDASLVYDDPQRHDMHARRLAPRREPDGRSSVIREGHPTGVLFGLNANTTDPAIQKHVPHGLFQRLRVIEGVPVPVGRPDAYVRDADRRSLGGPGSTVYSLPPIVPRRMLGEFPIEDDGSFHIELPADVPVQLQTLDENGMAMQTCGWIWVKPKETRGCIGCHEDPELTPENRFVKAVGKPAVHLTLPPERRRTVEFRRDVMPIVAQRCATADCHGGAAAPRLTDEAVGPFNRAYVSLLAAADAGASRDIDRPVAGKYVRPGSSRRSPLAWLVFGRNTARPWDAEHGVAAALDKTHPPITPALSDDERRTIVEWIDLGAAWSGLPEAPAVTTTPATPTVAPGAAHREPAARAATTQPGGAS